MKFSELINQLSPSAHSLTSHPHNNPENDLNEFYRYVDSRTDKLEAKFSSNIASGVEVKKALDEVKDLNERLDRFIRNYQNI